LSPESTAPSRRYRGLSIALLACLIVGLTLAYRTRGGSFRWNLLLVTIRQADWRWLAGSIGLILLSNVGRALRWQVMLRPLWSYVEARRIGVWRLTSDTAIGLTAGLLLGRIGEAVRPYLIAVQTGLPFSSQLAAWFLERILDLLVVLLLCGYALGALPTSSSLPLRAGGYLLVVMAFICIGVLLAIRDPSHRAQRRISDAIGFLSMPQQDRIRRALDSVSQALECTRDLKLLALLAFYTLLEWAILVSANYAFFRAFEATQSFGPVDVLVVMAFMALGSMVQLPAVGGGSQAACILSLTSVLRLSLEAASGIAVVLWVVGTIAIVPVGLACAFHEGLNWSKLKLLSTKQMLDSREA
jgi:glycosyltransferase 2 family protein